MGGGGCVVVGGGGKGRLNDVGFLFSSDSLLSFFFSLPNLSILAETWFLPPHHLQEQKGLAQMDAVQAPLPSSSRAEHLIFLTTCGTRSLLLSFCPFRPSVSLLRNESNRVAKCQAKLCNAVCTRFVSIQKRIRTRERKKEKKRKIMNFGVLPIKINN